MTSEQYNKVKEIFLAACEKPREEQAALVTQSADGDETVRLEVEGLLAEHNRGQAVIPDEPHSPMSSLLSRAGIHLSQAEQGEPVNNPDSLSAGGVLGDADTGSRSGFVDPGRFTAGTVVAGRYRIIELLGRGGMGEVYRADDIKLDQTIALKFLPRMFSQDTKWLERFHNEVRIARQVSHPNVCRVFDIGEFEGEQFISMEYIDGENLASLLRRIGRVSYDKAIQIAKQLCLGLAAAHDKGVLHRDLKPANVMIDGRGQVRITDFGLAAPVDQIRKEALRAGTPAYMSPEQLAGKAITVRSDVYCLGLVLYEMFTGKPTFKGETLRDYMKLHAESLPEAPSITVSDINPDVERVILRCLEKDPRNRPSSVLAVAAGLPGGNLLKEIIASGKTPSPEVVAAAGESYTGFRPAHSLLFLLAALACLVVAVLVAPNAFLVQQTIQEKPPAVLTDKARSILSDLGYTAPPRDWNGAFAINAAYYVYVQDKQTGPDRWESLTRPRPGLVYFWYRQSPELLMPFRSEAMAFEDDPPISRPGMINMRLDPLGRLISLHVRPEGETADIPLSDTPVTAAATSTQSGAGSQPSPTQPGPMDWTPLFSAAGLDPAECQKYFTLTEPRHLPPVYADSRIAMEGHFPEAPKETVRIEAAAYHGKPIYFTIIGPWRDSQLSVEQATILSMGTANLLVQTVVTMLLLLAGSYLAWRNYQSGRGDRIGATRISIAFFAFGFIVWVLRAHHVPDVILEFILFSRAMGSTLFPVALVWIFYLALEPYVRRAWPETIISWSRLISGQWSDPLVGRDALVGGLVGITTVVLTQIELLTPRWLSQSAPLPNVGAIVAMLHSASNFSTIFTSALSALYFGLILLLFLTLVRIILQRKILAAVAFIIVFVAATARWTPDSYMSWLTQTVIALLFLLLLGRYGLVAVIACILCRALLVDFPISPDFNLWFSTSSIVAILSVLAILGASFYTSLGGRPLFSLGELESPRTPPP